MVQEQEEKVEEGRLCCASFLSEKTMPTLKISIHNHVHFYSYFFKLGFIYRSLVLVANT